GAARPPIPAAFPQPYPQILWIFEYGASAVCAVALRGIAADTSLRAAVAASCRARSPEERQRTPRQPRRPEPRRLPASELDRTARRVPPAENVVQRCLRLRRPEEIEEPGDDRRILVEHVIDVRVDAPGRAAGPIERVRDLQVGVERGIHRVVVDRDAGR